LTEEKQVKIRLLPSYAGRDSQLQSLTSFLINDSVSIDGGSLGFALHPTEMSTVRHIVVTHAHSDHTASLPIFIAEAYPSLDAPVIIYGTSEVVSALKDFVFNDHIWPNFENILLQNGSGPTIEFQTIEHRQSITIAGLRVTAIPVNHVVPTVGLIVQEDGAVVAFTSDTFTTDEIWETARDMELLKAVFVDVSYPDELEWLASESKHLTPRLLAGELEKLNRDVEIYAVHIKPTNRKEVIRQLKMLKNPSVLIGEINRVYEW
jgi:cAMP phosphodiesterase